MKQFQVKSIGFFILLIAIAYLLAITYLSSEHTFYSWDYNIYATKAMRVSNLFIQDPLSAIKTIYLSTNSDYNDYFVLPLIPIILLFKYSRLGYILGVVFVYYIPMLIMAGQIAKLIFQSPPYIGWITIFTGILIPGVWASVLRGYPDIGALLLIEFAVFSYLKDIEFKSWRTRLPIIGFFSALAIVFRRHFAYNVVALIFSMVIISFFICIQQHKWDWRKILFEFRDYTIKLVIVLIILVLALVFFTPTFISRTISSNYLTLYASYTLSPAQTANFFFHTYGVLWFLASFGLIAALFKMKKISNNYNDIFNTISILFIMLFGVVSFILWITVPRQSGLQYTLHLALPLILGLSYLIVSTTNNLRLNNRWIGITVYIVFFSANLWIGLAPLNSVAYNWTLTANNPPLYREDYDEVGRLVTYLRQVTNGTKKIYVVDSSNLMNYEILRYAETSLYGKNAKLEILYSPQIDSRDFYPLEPLLQTDYIVITTPFQHHLTEEEQKVAKFVYDTFSQSWEMSNDFIKMPEEFRLSEGAVLSVYERKSPTSLNTILSTYYRMDNYISRFPGSQSNWILVTPVTEMNLVHQVRQKYFLTIPETLSDISFLYIDSAPAQGVVSGSVEFQNEQCAQIQYSIQLFSLPENLPVSYQAGQSYLRAGEFKIQFHKPDASALILSFQRSTVFTTPSCGINLEWEAIPYLH